MAEVLPVSLPRSESDRVAALFDAHHARLFRLARRLSTSRDDALDLLQETFLKVACAPRTVPLGARAEEAWLVRLLVNVCRDRWRQIEVRQRHQHHVARPEATDGEEAALIARDTVQRALATLTPRRRAVIVMHELEGMTSSAIAEQLGVGAVTVRWHLAMGRRQLRTFLVQTGDRT